MAGSSIKVKRSWRAPYWYSRSSIQREISRSIWWKCRNTCVSAAAAAHLLWLDERMSGEIPLRILEKSPSKRSQRNFKCQKTGLHLRWNTAVDMNMLWDIESYLNTCRLIRMKDAAVQTHNVSPSLAVDRWKIRFKELFPSKMKSTECLSSAILYDAS